MKKMIEQLKELAQLQKEYDEAVLKQKGIEKYPTDNMRVALFVELGELMNEFPTKFKRWKSTAKDSRYKGLEEYVDALHFQLSLANFARLKFASSCWYDFYAMEYYPDIDMYLHVEFGNFYTFSDILQYCVGECFNIKGIISLFMIGNILGFTWDEIYEAYKKNNAVNWERLKTGY